MRTPPTDEGRLLVERLAAGERRALEEVYDRFGDALFRYLLALTKDRQLAQEALQDTLVAVWRAAGTFRGRSSVSTWVFGVARRQGLNAQRRSLRWRDASSYTEPDLEVLVDPEPGPEDDLLARIRREELEALIEELSPVHGEALTLFFFNDLSHEETAEVLGVPIGTVKSRISNAKRALRKALGVSSRTTTPPPRDSKEEEGR